MGTTIVDKDTCPLGSGCVGVCETCNLRVTHVCDICGRDVTFEGYYKWDENNWLLCDEHAPNEWKDIGEVTLTKVKPADVYRHIKELSILLSEKRQNTKNNDAFNDAIDDVLGSLKTLKRFF